MKLTPSTSMTILANLRPPLPPPAPAAVGAFGDHSIGAARLPQATIVEGLASDAPTLM